MADTKTRQKFYVDLIKPSHYDDDGYVIQWHRAFIPSNTLASLYGLTLDAIEKKALGEDVDVILNAYDETNTVIPVKDIIKRHSEPGVRAIVAMVGVQSNQFPRTMDMAREFRAAGLQVAIGGFHASGCISMLPELPPDLQEAVDLGITLYAGEGEGGRLIEFYRAAFEGTLEPIYNYMSDLPGLQNEPVPYLPVELVRRYDATISCFDAGRGCPYQCSFCTIINVQGRKSRFRDADDVERQIRQDVAQGVTRWFLTDDNFARNKNWEAIFDRIGDLKEEYNLPFSLLIQVDTLCHKIPNFIAKAKRAGVGRAYIGLENINPDNLMAVKKKQNRITEYRKMIQAWRNAQITTYAGYILGFPNDTVESLERDIEIVKNELAIDVLEFFCLTPLPGSEDHRKMYLSGVPMDPDMNKYDLEHVCAPHPLMSKDEWQDIYVKAWDMYYSREHTKVLMKRNVATGNKPERIWAHAVQFHGCMKFEKLHPIQGGLFRRKVRTQRRSGMPIVPAWKFYPKRIAEWIWTYSRFLAYGADRYIMCKMIKWDPRNRAYMDRALTPVDDDHAETEHLEMYEHSDAAKAAVAKAKGEAEARARRAAEVSAEEDVKAPAE